MCLIHCILFLLQTCLPMNSTILSIYKILTTLGTIYRHVLTSYMTKQSAVSEEINATNLANKFVWVIFRMLNSQMSLQRLRAAAYLLAELTLVLVMFAFNVLVQSFFS